MSPLHSDFPLKGQNLYPDAKVNPSFHQTPLDIKKTCLNTTVGPTLSSMTGFKTHSIRNPQQLYFSFHYLNLNCLTCLL